MRKRTNWMGSGGPETKLKGRALKREEVPDDLVGTCIYLASADSDIMTGQTIVVDGGAPFGSGKVTPITIARCRGSHTRSSSRP